MYDTELCLIQEFPGEKDDKLHIVSPDGNYLVAGSSGKTALTAFNLKEGSSFKIVVHPIHDKSYKTKKKDLGIRIVFFDFLDDSNTLFISGDKFRTIVNSFADNSQTILKGHNDEIKDMFFSGVNTITISTSHSYILTAATDCTEIIWDRDYNIQGHLIGHNLGVTKAIYLNEFDKIVTTSVDGTVRIWAKT